MMAWAMDQLRREGVPEQHLRQAAAHLVGQAHMESGLDPNKTHDGGTGYGIYGARDPKGWGNYRGARRSGMVRWLEANGYARNSAEGQMRYMVREAMRGGYGRTRRILMGEGTGNVEADTNTITREFEAPAVINRRSGAVSNAYRIGPNESALRPSEAPSTPVTPASSDAFRDYRSERERLAREGKAPTEEEDDGVTYEHWRLVRRPGKSTSGSEGERPGDAMMRRFYGQGGPMSVGKGSLHIKLEGAPPGTKVKASMDDLFRKTTVEQGRSQMDMA